MKDAVKGVGSLNAFNEVDGVKGAVKGANCKKGGLGVCVAMRGVYANRCVLTYSLEGGVGVIAFGVVDVE